MFTHNKEIIRQMSLFSSTVYRVCLSLVLLGFMFLMSCSTVSAQEKYAEFEVGWMQLDDTPEKVVSIFGQPKSINEKDAYGPFGKGWIWRTYEFDGLSVTFIVAPNGSGGIHRLSTTSPDLYTKRGIRAGDSLDKVKEIYPEGSYGRYGKNKFMYKVGSRYISFLIGSDGRVTQVNLAYDGV